VGAEFANLGGAGGRHQTGLGAGVIRLIAIGDARTPVPSSACTTTRYTPNSVRSVKFTLKGLFGPAISVRVNTLSRTNSWRDCDGELVVYDGG
jgi:hypothetical protein